MGICVHIHVYVYTMDICVHIHVYMYTMGISCRGGGSGIGVNLGRGKIICMGLLISSFIRGVIDAWCQNQSVALTVSISCRFALGM